MRRSVVACSSLAVVGDRRKPLLDVEIAVVTPLFGRGAAARGSDPLLPVRCHLRFWWRAC
jgi:CRISPR/Cas system CMR-associated protein Cmr1 (group 7 of RAMP superfamily)